MVDDDVTFFGQRMPRDWAEMLQQSQEQLDYIDVADRTAYRRIPYGSETFRQPTEAATRPCRHCRTVAGMLHEPQCDYEQCPKCNWQIMSCDCEFVGWELS